MTAGRHHDTHRRLRVAVAAALVAALVVFAALADELAEWQPFVSLDRHVDEELNENATPWVTTLMKLVSRLGSTPVLLVLTAAVVVALIAKHRPRAALFVSLAFAGAELLDAALKVEFARPRPSFAEPVIAKPAGYSFPSGHATASMAFYGAFAYLAVTSWRRRPVKAAVVAALLVLVGAIGFSRVYLGAHFPSDVIAGWCVAVAWLAILILLMWGAVPAATLRAARADRRLVGRSGGKRGERRREEPRLEQ